MRRKHKVILKLGAERKSGRAILRGIARFSSLHDPWVFESEPPFYWKYPYSVATGVPNRQKTLTWLRKSDVDGIITFVLNEAHANTFIPAGFPSVVVPVQETIPGRCNIIEERYAVGRMAAEHLLDRGFKRFAFCGLDHTYWSRIRREGFVHRLTAAGFKPAVYQPKRPSSRISWETEQRSLAKWLRSLPKPTGLMAFNDERAQQVLEAGKLAEVRVPDEIAVIGVDDDDIICGFADPSLSSIVLNFEEVGYEAAWQLHFQMKGAKPSEWEIRQRPKRVVTRQSTDIIAVEDKGVGDALHFIRAHSAEMITVPDVTGHVSVSRRLLERHFQQILGRSIRKEIERCHVEHACQLLDRTSLPAEKIAERSGFSGQVHFAVAFKRVMNMTPRQYRDQNAVAK